MSIHRAATLARLMAFAIRHADEPEGEALADALTAWAIRGTPLETSLGLSSRRERRDALLRDLHHTCLPFRSPWAAASIIAAEYPRFRRQAWPHRLARLRFDPWPADHRQATPALFYQQLCIESLPVPASERHIYRILRPEADAAGSSRRY